MPDKNKDTVQNNAFKADDFDKEKEEAKKNEEETKAMADSSKSNEQEILKKQKETD